MNDRDQQTGGQDVPFTGYPAPTSNTTYTPNQFFDVVLPHSSRGCVRLVAYMIRKTLGWSDAEGNPQQPHVVVSYNQLIREAGISRGAIAPAIEEALAGRYIQQVRKGRASTHRQTAVSALFELCWDESGDYIKDPGKFAGFFAGNGNLTYIPNAFFDYTVPNEPLAVIKVVGAIIRYTIGFQTKFGFRRQQIEMSFTRLQRITGIVSRRSLNAAIQHSLENNHLQRISEGCFDANAGRESKPAVYAIKWSDTNIYPMLGSKRTPESSEKNLLPPEGSVQKGYRTPRELIDEIAAPPVQEGYRHRFNKDTEDQAKKDTGTGSEMNPAPVQEGHPDRSTKDTGIEITTSNNTNKQQQAAAVKSVERLMREGFDPKTAEALANSYPPLSIERQCEWIAARRPNRNRLGMLRRSIEEDWPAPEGPAVEGRGSIFASHFYAAWAGNDEVPAASALASDIEAGDRFVDQLLRFYPREDKVCRMGRSFGTFVREQERANPGMPRSLKLALSRHGDAFIVDFKQKIRVHKKKSAERAKRRHYERFKNVYRTYLHEQASRLQEESPLMYASFEEAERTERAFLAKSPFCTAAAVMKGMLDTFDSDNERLKRFYEFFKSTDDRVLDFWEWDRNINPASMGHEVASA